MIIKKITKKIKNLLKLFYRVDHHQIKSIILSGLLLSENNRRKININTLNDVEFSAFSQWGEDGIIDWLIERLPEIPSLFIEFGVEDYRESNTRFLLHTRNWRGLVIDGSEDNVKDIRSQSISWRYDVQALHSFIDKDNINTFIAQAGIQGEIGLLSVDIDGNDYWVWKAIDVVNPAIVVCEYNALFGDLYQISVPYQADFQRSNGHYSNLYFGASLPAIKALAHEKGYCFVGTNRNGCNAFFVRNDLSSSITNAIAEVKSYPSLFCESRDEKGTLTYMRGDDRLGIIKHKQVFDFVENRNRPLGELGNLYSQAWTRSVAIH